MKKRANTGQKLLLVGLSSLFAIALVGCDMLMGPQGEKGEQGPRGAQGAAGEGLYLVDADGVRIASGGSYYLGEAIEGAADVVSSFFLVNKSGLSLELVEITDVSSYQVETSGGVINVDAVDEITFAYTGGQTIAHGALSDAIIVTFEFFDLNGSGSSDGIAHKRLQIALTGGGNDIFFNVEVYGVLTGGV